MRHSVILGFGTVTLLAAPASAVEIKPGKWVQQTKTTEFDAPGLPAQARQMMAQQMIGKEISTSYCITPEEAANGPKRMLEESRRQNSKCKVTKFNVSGGKIDNVMECKADESGITRMTMQGDYTPNSYRITMNMEGAGMIRRMTSVSTARHVGACN